MNIKEIKEIINLMNENALTEFELERDGLRIRLRKGTGGAIEGGLEKILVATSPPPAPQETAPQAAQEIPKEVAAKAVEIKAPIVGTFYRAPSPDSPPFVEVGSMIEPGQVVCIIEAMKLMNEIKSELGGKIVDVLIENGDPVEFGTVLFLVEPK
ncbi:MAG: acetyl-CoA carboxylase biotin carboxyl carrier protein [Candidatus Omnitrophica bacterium]|nr:acetyl-CoA carboxylase biotin carboxyl carrier protein [Candidatus Omnitrophota bacterium]